MQSIAKPLVTGAAALFPYDQEWVKKFTLPAVFDTGEDGSSEDFPNYKIIGSGASTKILLPRAMFPVGNVDKRVKGESIELPSYFKPRNDDQARVVAESAALLNQGESFVVQCPTGWGKTILGAELVTQVGRRALVILNKEDIFDQWFEAFEKVSGLTKADVGVIRGDICKVQDRPVALGYIQSLCKDGRYPSWIYDYFGFVIWDEVHRVGADKFSETAWKFPGLLRLGLSARVKRKDGRDAIITSHIGPVKVQAQQAALAFKVIAVHTDWRVPRYKDAFGDIRQIPHSPGKTMHVFKAMASDPRRNDLIGQYVGKAYGKGRTIIVFSDTLKHLERLYDLCLKYGVPRGELAYYVGGLSKAEREAAKASGRVLLATYKMASEATDIPRLDTAVLCTPRSDVLQIVGRIRRVYEGKKDPLVIDLVDTDSPVFAGYFKSRMRWYQSEGATVV